MVTRPNQGDTAISNEVLEYVDRVLNHTSRTNNCLEGWHNAFQTGMTISHPSFPKLVNHFQREQAVKDAKYAKWEGGINIRNQNQARRVM